MTIRWITDRLGTSPWNDELASGSLAIVDVRLVRDSTGNTPTLIREKVGEALRYLRSGERVVICCDHGMSRSNAIAAAVYAEETGVSLEEGLRLVVKKTGETGIKIDLVSEVRKALGVDYVVGADGGTYVLGGGGFIGRALNRVISPHLRPPSHEEALLENPVLLDSLLYEADATGVVFCWQPHRLDTNRAAGQLIAALRNVLEVCRIRDTRLIFISGQQIFAGHGGTSTSFSEDHEPAPAGAAGDGLFLAETLVKQYEKRHQLSTLIIRAPHVFGPGDERPGLVNTFVRKALANQDIITHRFQDGSPLVDLLHVLDLGSAVQTAVAKRLSGVLHVTSGNPISTDALARMIVDRADSRSAVSAIDMPGKSSVPQLESFSSRELLDWSPSVPLADGLSDLIDYARKNPHGSKDYDVC